jgi:hypothetical protein
MKVLRVSAAVSGITALHTRVKMSYNVHYVKLWIE